MAARNRLKRADHGARKSPKRTPRPFDSTEAAHLIVQVAERLDWDLRDPAIFSQHVQRVEFGLSAEIELAALLRWLGRCPLVHRVSDECLQEESAPIAVPDLFALFEHDGRRLTVLIEVKTTQGDTLELSANYLARLRAYATLAGHPLLIAWKARVHGMWLMFDPAVGARPAGNVKIAWTTALKADLLSALAGDHWLVPIAGTGLHIFADRVSPLGPDYGQDATFVVRDAYYEDAQGVRTTTIAPALFWILMAGAESVEHTSADRAELHIVARDQGIRVQQVLWTAARWDLEPSERIHWKQIARSMDQYVTAQEIVAAADEAVSRFIRYIFLVYPTPPPASLPAAWSAPAADRA